MPEEKEKPKFEGERSMLPFFLAGLPLAYATYRGRGAIGRAAQTVESGYATQSAALDKVVGGRAANYFKELSMWKADKAALAEGVEPLVLESFKRKLGPTGHAVHVQNLQTAMEMVQGKPGMTAMLRQSFEELVGVEAGAIGATTESLFGGLTGVTKVLKPSTSAYLTSAGGFGPRMEVLGELLTALMRPELKMGGAEAVRVAGSLQELAQVAERTFGHKPTFRLMMAGKDAATSEMLLTFPRTGGRALEFTLPLPTAEGLLMQPSGQAYFARRVLAEPATFARQGGAPLDISAPEAIIQRLRNIMTQPTDVPMARRFREAQQQVRQLMIWQGPEVGAEAGVVTGRTGGRAYTQQLVVDPWFEETQATRLQAAERLALEGRAAGLTEGTLAKNVFRTAAGAEEVPSLLSPKHFGQAQTKGLPYNLPAEWEGAQLFQISPGGAQAAAERYGYEFVPRQDTIMMAQNMRETLMGMSRREIKIDPTLPAGKRIQRIQQMLMDYQITKDMLTGGSTVGEALQAYAITAPGRGADIARMQELLTLQQGEILGFTKAGAVKAETYGLGTFIRGIKTIGPETVIETEARFPMVKAFSTGGIKHTVEYADEEIVRKVALHAKTEELLRAQTEEGRYLIPMEYKAETRRQMARVQARKLWEGSQGIVVEGAAPHDIDRAWKTWTKIDAGKKNQVRFNQLMMQRLEEEGIVIPPKMAGLENLEMQRRQIEALARARGIDPATTFHPAMMARRLEQLRMGEAPEIAQGLGRAGSYTDDVFELFRQFGLTNVAEDVEARVIRDIPVQRLMETTFRAVRAGEAALPGAVPYEEWAEMVFARGEGAAGTVFDPMVRAELQARGGVLRLPRAYTVGGAKIQHIPIPELESGYAGYFTTREGQVMQKDLDRALRGVMEATVMDVGAAGTGVEPAAAGALEEYFSLIDKIRLNNRDLIGGKLEGSRIMRAGKWLDEGQMIAAEGGGEVAIPRGRITPHTFRQMLKERARKGLLKDITAEELTQAFKMGRLPSTFVKHPALGPLSAMPAFVGPAVHAGAEHDVLYVDSILHRAMNIDLDLDPMHVDMATTRAAFNESTAALESGGVGNKIALHQRMSEAMAAGSPAEATVIAKDPIPLWIKGRINPDVIRERTARLMASKADIGIFHTQVAQPIAQTARELGLGWEEVFITNLWRQAVEEGSAIKAQKALEMPPQLTRQVAEAFRSGRHDRLMSLTQDILQMQPGEAKLMMDDIIERMAQGYTSLSAEKRSYIEALYASKSRASARNLMAVADGKLGAEMAGAGAARAEVGAAGRVTTTMSRTLGHVTQFVRGHKKGVVLTLAASAALGLIAARPRDLTPEAIESGALAGGQMGSGTTAPKPPLTRNLHYRDSATPGFRVRANLNKIVDHEMLGNKASQMVGNRSVRIDVSDRRRRVTRQEIELAMRDDRILGSRTGQVGFYNNYRG